MTRDIELEATLVAKYAVVTPVLDERSRRRWAAAESRAIGYGGDAVVSSATGLARATIRKGRREIARDEAPTDRIRRPGGGRPRIQQGQPGIQAALEALVDPLTRGDPTSPLRWTCKSRAKLAAALTEQGWRVSSTTVGRLLHHLGYRLQSPRKRQEGTTHPDRNAQFEHINRAADKHLSAGQPVISVDTKKKELVGNFKNGGREWQPKGTPPAVLVHDFPTDAEGKAIPYGVCGRLRKCKPFSEALLLRSVCSSGSPRQRSGSPAPRLFPWNEGQPSGWPARTSRTVGRGCHPQGRNGVEEPRSGLTAAGDRARGRRFRAMRGPLGTSEAVQRRFRKLHFVGWFGACGQVLSCVRPH